MKQNSTHSPTTKKGFTLFELVIALGIAGFVLTSIFRIADGAVRSTTKMVDIQDEDISRDAFFSFLRNHFDSLPGNAVLNLQNTSSAEPFLSEMTFQNTPVSFNWGGVPIAAEATRIITVPTITNGIDIVLEYYDEAILDSDEGPAERGIDPIASIVLLNDVRLFEWNVIDGRQYNNFERDDWPYIWDQNNRRPTYVELKVIFANDDPPITRLFWIPTKANPQTTMNALKNKAGSARGQGSTGNGGQTRPGRPEGGNGTGAGGRPQGGGNTGSRPQTPSGSTVAPSIGR